MKQEANRPSPRGARCSRTFLLQQRRRPGGGSSQGADSGASAAADSPPSHPLPKRGGAWTRGRRTPGPRRSLTARPQLNRPHPELPLGEGGPPPPPRSPLTFPRSGQAPAGPRLCRALASRRRLCSRQTQPGCTIPARSRSWHNLGTAFLFFFFPPSLLSPPVSPSTLPPPFFFPLLFLFISTRLFCYFSSRVLLLLFFNFFYPGGSVP